MIAFSIFFIWYWFPDFIFPALSYFTWICWIAPKNAVVNQIFGMKSGIGLLPITYDCQYTERSALPLPLADILNTGSQIAYIGSPLVIPAWAILNILASLVFWIYIVTPALYYSNTWFTAYLPLQTNSIFDNMGKVYNVSRVIDKADGFVLNFDKYEKYSKVKWHMPKSISRLVKYNEANRNRRSTFLSLMHSTPLASALRQLPHYLHGSFLRRGTKYMMRFAIRLWLSDLACLPSRNRRRRSGFTESFLHIGT